MARARKAKPSTKAKAKKTEAPKEQIKSKAGRPTGYKPEYVEQAEKLCKLGATDMELADFFNVSERTIYRWSSKFPEFCQALKSGKDVADERVERSLYHKAVGYTYETVKIFNSNGEPLIVPYREHVPPSDTAAIFWLKNRRSDEWRDKRDVDLTLTNHEDALAALEAEAEMLTDELVGRDEYIN